MSIKLKNKNLLNKNITKITVGEQEIGKVFVGDGANGIKIFENTYVCDWATGTASQIKQAIAKHKKGIVNLYKHPGWQIGSKRTVTLSDIPVHKTKTLNGSTWWFKGRKDSTYIIDTDNIPNYSGDFYLLTKTKPSDWNNNYFNYYTRTGSRCNWVYTKVPQGSIPTWQEDKYFKKDSNKYWDITFTYYLVKTKSQSYSGTYPKSGLKKGNSGTQVKYLQKFLNWAISSGLSVDGKFGTKTQSSVKRFQKKVRLTQSGVFNSDTLSKAKSYKLVTEEKTWAGDFNGLGKTSQSNLCYLKIDKTSYIQTEVYKNTIDGTNITPKWNNPSVASPFVMTLYQDSANKYVLSSYQEIKITGGNDIQNPDLMDWLLENADCTSLDDSQGYSYDVPESQNKQTVNLVLAEQACSINEDGEMVADKGFTLATGSSTSDQASLVNQLPVFIVQQEGVLSTPGLLKKATGTTTKTTKVKYTGTYPNKTMSKGASGTQVKNLQRFLNWAVSAGLSVDGKYGSKTTSAVKKFQKAVGITQSGKFNKTTLNKAKTYTKSSSSKVSVEVGSNLGSWGGTIRKDWCDNGYFESLPDNDIFQEFNWYIGYGNATEGATMFTSRVGLPLEVNVTGTRTHSTMAEFSNHGYTQWEYYKNKSNRIKKDSSGTPRSYWLASPDTDNTTNYVTINVEGNSSTTSSNNKSYFSPFMII